MTDLPEEAAPWEDVDTGEGETNDAFSERMDRAQFEREEREDDLND